MTKTPADAVRRAYRDPQFAKDFLNDPEKFRAEYGLTDDAIAVIKNIDPNKVVVAAEFLSPLEAATNHEKIADIVKIIQSPISNPYA